MSLNADQGMGLELFEVEVTKIAVNRMEHCCLLHEGVLEGMVGRQSRKSCLISDGMSAGEITASGAGEWSSLDMRGELLSSSVSMTPLLICVITSGFFFLKSASASSACKSSQSTHWLSDSGYPFHLTKYCTLHPLPNFCDCRTSSTSYSSSPSIRSGGGLV